MQYNTVIPFLEEVNFRKITLFLHILLIYFTVYVFYNFFHIQMSL